MAIIFGNVELISKFPELINKHDRTAAKSELTMKTQKLTTIAKWNDSSNNSRRRDASGKTTTTGVVRKPDELVRIFA